MIDIVKAVDLEEKLGGLLDHAFVVSFHCKMVSSYMLLCGEFYAY